MNKKTIVGLGLALAVPALILGYASGPPAGASGVDGEATCAQAGCHIGTASSAGGGVAVSFSGGGQNYAPGTAQTLTITITEPAGARLYGFQLTARRAANLKESAGSLAGTGLLSLCGSTDLTREIPKPAGGCTGNTPLEFISHSNAQSGNTFTVTWTPPATDVGDVRIFVAANAANGNGQNTGDRIYTANYTLTVQAASGPKPTIRTTDGVVNGASFSPGIVSGSWTTIFGTDLAGSTRIWRNDEIVNGKLPTSLDGVSVNINGKPASVYFISPTQINVQAPTDDSIGPVQVEVVRDGQRSTPVSANMVRNTPGFFLFDPQNRKYLAAVISDGTFLGPAGLFGSALTTRGAKPGEVVLLFGTGFGPTNPPVPAGQVFNGANALVDSVRITVGGVQATVQFSGLSGAGLYQFNVVVPDLPNGDHAVVAEVGGLRSQENAFITVQR